jgi:type IV pilus assembly protein PilC
MQIVKAQNPAFSVPRGAARRRPSKKKRGAAAAGAEAGGWLEKLKKAGAKVKTKDLAIFTRQFGVMIGAGLPLVQALDLLGGQQENKAFGEVLDKVRTAVEGGATLSSSAQRFPKVFDPLYTNMLEAGEAGGVLEGVLQRLAAYIEKAVKLRAAVKSALIYPVAVLVIAAGVIMLLLWKVVPIFATLFAGLDATMPLPTRMVIELSRMVGRFAWLFFIGAIAAVVAAKRYYATSSGRARIDAMILRVPVLGVLMRKICVARFARTLSTLISSGVPMLESLDITARTAGNAVVEKAIMTVRTEVEAGHNVADPMRRSGVFPNVVVRMVAVGEQTGALDTMLHKIADFFEDEVDTAVANLLSAMEPAIIVVLGCVVGGIVISMYLPLFSLIGKLAG